MNGEVLHSFKCPKCGEISIYSDSSILNLVSIPMAKRLKASKTDVIVMSYDCFHCNNIYKANLIINNNIE